MPEYRPRVVLGADPLFQPLTGIGTYTYSLASNLLALQLVEELTLYANGIILSGDKLPALVDSSVESISGQSSSRGSEHAAKLLSKLQGSLVSKGWAIRAYKTLMPLVDKARLYPYRDAVFHSPNYLLPPFNGPTVVTIHDLSIQRFPQFHPAKRVSLLDARIAKAAASATHIITDSACVKTEIIEHFGVDESRVTAIPLAADERFRPRSEEDCRSVLDAFKIRYEKFYLFAGTIEPRKNVIRICMAYKALRAAGRVDWPIIFVGGAGWKSEAEHRAIQSLVERGWAQYLGFVDENTLPILYSAAGALMFPSIYEGFGLPALEAQQSGTRVITSAGSAMAEFSGEHDLLVEPQEVDSLMEAMTTVVELQSANSGQPLRCGGSGLSWQKTAQLTADVYITAQGT